jgi:beta-glucosidase
MIRDSKRFADVGAAPFRDPSLGFGRRADDLLARLTDREKIAMLHQRSPAVPRLGLAEFRTGTEALHGAAWLGPATVFPQAVGLGATWDPGLVTEVGLAAAREVRALHDRDPLVSLNVWAPVVNLLRDPRWGRNEEGYSEDPLLTARTAIAYCRGLRGEHPGYLRTAPTLKHFLGYNNETDRATTSSVLRPRVRHEYDLPPFRDPIAAGAACGVMPGYNLVNGRPCHVGPYLELARSWSPEELLICSDAWAPSNLVGAEHYFEDHPAGHAAALRAGLDSFTDHDCDGGFTTAQVTEALARGMITMADVDRAVRRKLLLRLRCGEFDPDGGPYAADGAGALDCPAHRDLARRAARRAVVLLKNEGGLLPLAPGRAARVAVLGPFADALREDWYSGTMPYRVTAAGGLREALPDAEVTTAEGADRVLVRARAPGGPDLGEFDVFDWGDGIVTLRAAASGRYLTVAGDGSLAAEAERPNGWVVRETFGLSRLPDGGVLLRSAATGRYLGTRAGTLAACAPGAAAAEPLSWQVLADGAEQAAAAARDADVAVIVAGNDPLINGRETQDRTTLALPPAQERLIRAVRAASPRTVLVLMSSYPYAVSWADEHVPAIVWTCHGGQEAGRGLADVLLGRHGPSGRLPQTWYRRDEDLPGIGDYDIIKSRRTYLYFGGEPLYPFGHGLAYTEFGYRGLRLDGPDPDAAARPGDVVTASVEVANTGGRAGEEVVQLYVRALPGPGADRLREHRPRRQLAGFARLELAPGAVGTAEIPLPVSSLACWDVETHQMVVAPGDYEVMAGPSSGDIRLTAVLTVPGPAEPEPRRLAGRAVPAADFDDYEGVTLVDVSRDRGDAVTPAGPDADGWIVFRHAWAGPAGRASATFRVSADAPAGARVELRWSGGTPLGGVAVPRTGGRYRWAEVTAPVTLPGGTGDLYLALRGPVRLDWFRIDPGAPDAPGQGER